MYWHLGRRFSGEHRRSVDKKHALIDAGGLHATVVHLRTRRELREFYAAHGLELAG